MTSRLRRRTGSSLFAMYVFASLVPVGVLGAVLVRGYHDEGLEHGRDQGRAQAAVIQQMARAPALSGADLSEGLSATERQRLESATDLAIFNGSVSHLRLRSFAGIVAFSDDGSVVGSVPVNDPAFRTAAAGGTDVRIVETDQSRAIRVVQPVFAAANGEATGILEIYPTNSDALVQLRTGRAAAVVTDLPPAIFLTTDARTRSQYQLASTSQYEPGLYGIVVAKSQPRLHDASQGALETLKRSGVYADVLARWHVNDGAIQHVTINSER